MSGQPIGWNNYAVNYDDCVLRKLVYPSLLSLQYFTLVWSESVAVAVWASGGRKTEDLKMKSFALRGLIVATLLSLGSVSAVAQDRLPNVPDSPENLNAESGGFISSPDGVNAVTDPGFEAGTPNPFWNEFSAIFGTLLCSVPSCGDGGGTTGPNSGSWWAWFGGGAIFGGDEGTVDQDVTFPSGAATLSFYFSAPACGDVGSFLELNVDGNQEWVASGDDPLCGFVGYTQQFVDLSAYADGGVHNIEFHGVELAIGGTSNFLVDDVELLASEPPALARFLVSKDFNDGNDAEVDVVLTCNTGLPLSQPATISEGDPVNFVVGDFEQGALSCSVTEVTPAGYTASYDDGSVSSTNCSWTEITGGQYACVITNSLDEVEVEVTKVWIDENPQFNAQNIASADWSCSNVAFGRDEGVVQFDGNPDDDSFYVYPDWETGTTCSVTEVNLLESGIEVDDSECQGLTLWPGVGASCTIYNTRLYEGIPTLSQYGLALMALLMLGVGFVAFRRFS